MAKNFNSISFTVLLLVLAVASTGIFKTEARYPEPKCPEPKCPTPKCPKPYCPKLICPKPKCPEPKCPKTICPKPQCPKPKCPTPTCPEPKCPAPTCPKPKCLASGCTNPVFSEECGPEPFTGTDEDCCNCCVNMFGTRAVCKGVVEGIEKHCHCYKESAQSPEPQSPPPQSPPPQSPPPQSPPPQSPPPQSPPPQSPPPQSPPPQCLASGCTNPVFSEECGPEPFTGTDEDCCNCCVNTFGASAVCKGVVEGIEGHCHCYKESSQSPPPQSPSPQSPPTQSPPPQSPPPKSPPPQSPPPQCLASGCTNPVFSEECGPEPFTGTDEDCCNCCVNTFGASAVCKGVVEGIEGHCHCYKESSQSPPPQSPPPQSPPPQSPPPQSPPTQCLSSGCTNPVFSEECGPVPFTGSNNDCCNCCVNRFGASAVCKGVVEGIDNHCHCYKESAPSPVLLSPPPQSPPPQSPPPQSPPPQSPPPQSPPPQCLPSGCTNPVFSEECGPVPFTGSNQDCCNCCVNRFGASAVCKGVVEGIDNHCHCYKESA